MWEVKQARQRKTKAVWPHARAESKTVDSHSKRVQCKLSEARKGKREVGMERNESKSSKLLGGGMNPVFCGTVR